MQLLSKLLVALHPGLAPFVENMQSSKQKGGKNPGCALGPQQLRLVPLRSEIATQAQRWCSFGALAPEEQESVLPRTLLRVGAP